MVKGAARNAILEISQFDPDDSLLGTNLQAQAAVYTGPPVDQDLTILTFQQGWTFEECEAVVAGHTSAYHGHGNGGGRTVLRTDVAGGAFAKIDGISMLILADSTLWTLDQTDITQGTLPTVKTPPRLPDYLLLIGEEMNFPEILLSMANREGREFNPCLGFHLVGIH